jgi:hypothetical protein
LASSADCKSVAVWLWWFDSISTHQFAFSIKDLGAPRPAANPLIYKDKLNALKAHFLLDKSDLGVYNALTMSTERKTMPYITEESRNQIDEGAFPNNEGELNYMISSLLDEYLAEYGCNYANLNQVVGVLECAKLEIYRRMAAPYEDKKILENGDVYNQSYVHNYVKAA